MWTRAELKTRAKAVLHHNYWRAFFMSLILLIAGATYSNIDFSSKNNAAANNHVNNYVSVNESFSYNDQVFTFNDTSVHVMPVKTGFLPGFLAFAAGFLQIAVLIAAVAYFLFKLLIGYGLQIGGRRYFINATTEPQTDFKCLSMAFRDGNTSNIIVTMFLRDLYTFLWTLLFVIPGVVKGLAYSMVPYILADNPKMSADKAIQLSMKMTYGHKWQIFVLKLSFIGWYILGNLAFLVGVAFVFPYENAVFAQLYTVLRQNAVDNGTTSYDELNMYTSYQA